MRSLFVLFLTTLAAWAADDPWAKVRELKTGTEIRVFKHGSMQPVLGTMDEATDDHLVVVVKNEQTAISREQIDRLDVRPPQPGGRFVRESKSETKDPDAKSLVPYTPGGTVPSQSNTTTVMVHQKPEFETVYRKPPPPKSETAKPEGEKSDKK
jgi:hypothetical protein